MMDRQWFKASWIPLIFLFLLHQGSIIDGFAKEDLCRLNNGEEFIQMNVKESRGSQTNQIFEPAELPIIGNLSEISLEFFDERNSTNFILIDKTVHLIRPLDRDVVNGSSVKLQVACKKNVNNSSTHQWINVTVSDINDNAPVFLNSSQTPVSELAPIGSTVGSVKAVDIDAGMNAQIKYLVILGNVSEELKNGSVSDGAEHFMMKSEDSGEIVLKKALDYELVKKYLVTIQATDQAENPAERLTSTTTFTVTVNDEDDQDPSFEYKNCSFTSQNGACLDPKYHITIASGVLSGVLTLKPENIHAVDLDSFNSSIRYTFWNGTPEYYSDYFEIDSKFGIVKQIKTVYANMTNIFVITVKAEEKESKRRSTTAQLYIYVKQAICSSASDDKYGYIDENSTAGTKILDKRGQPIVLTVSDNNSCQKNPEVSYTFEVFNSLFTVDSDGYICVNNKILVSDSPSTRNYTFQIKAIGKNGYGFDSLPYQMTIFLNDNNATVIDKELNSTIISASEQGASESEIDRITESIKTTVQVTAEDHVSDNNLKTTTPSSALNQADGNNGDSVFNNIYLPIALLVLVLVIIAIVYLIVSRCKEMPDKTDTKPYYYMTYPKPCDHMEQVLYTSVTNGYNNRLESSEYMVRENVDHYDDRHDLGNTTKKTASVNRIGSKGTSTDNQSKKALDSKRMIYDHATVEENEFEQPAAYDARRLTTFTS